MSASSGEVVRVRRGGLRVGSLRNVRWLRVGRLRWVGGLRRVDRLGLGVDRLGLGIERIGLGVDRLGLGIERIGLGIDRFS